MPALVVIDCPFCSVKRIGMQIIGWHMSTPERLRNLNRGIFAIAAAACPNCERSVSLEIVPRADYPIVDNTVRYQMLAAGINKWLQAGQSVPEDHGLSVELIYTPPRDAEVPQYLPPKVEKAFRQGLSNARAPHSEEAAATMFRRAVQLVLRELYPERKGDLMDVVRDLAREGVLPKTMSDWAHQVRIIGNDGAHDLDGVTADDVEDAKNFTEALLQYLVTLPELVKARMPGKAPETKDSIAAEAVLEGFISPKK